MNNLEKLYVNSPFRALYQRHITIPFFKSGAALPQGSRCLEIGCGRGIGARMVINDFAEVNRVVGIDFDSAQLAKAHRRYRNNPQMQFLKGSASRLPFPDESFDAVFDFGILHHVIHWRKAVAEAGRALRPGGYFLVEDITKPVLDSLFFRIQFDHPEEGKFEDYQFMEALAENRLEVVKKYELARHYLLLVTRKTDQEKE
ncbi:MAG: class I SAM-dependent methyltransferase [bacterium]